MSSRRILERFRPDPYILAICGMVGLATILPARGALAPAMNWATTLAISLLFFLYGTRLSPQAVVAGMAHWRLQLMVFVSTFLIFPVLGLGFSALMRPVLGVSMATGLLYLTTLPSTVQSSIAFTSIGRGNVAAALCSASVSNLIGVLVTPLLVGLLMSTQGGFQLEAIGDIALQILLPFLAGQLVRPWLGPWIARHTTLTGFVDRGSILLIVYTAFSEGVVGGLWHQVDAKSLALVLLADCLLLAAILAITTWGSRLLGFTKEDEIAIVFCGSKKSMAAGLAMAKILFTGPAFGPVGLLVLPIMPFHQIQLIACAAMARQYGARVDQSGEPPQGALTKPASASAPR